MPELGWPSPSFLGNTGCLSGDVLGSPAHGSFAYTCAPRAVRCSHPPGTSTLTHQLVEDPSQAAGEGQESLGSLGPEFTPSVGHSQRHFRLGGGIGSSQKVHKEQKTRGQGHSPGLWWPLSCGWSRVKSANGGGRSVVLLLHLPGSAPSPRPHDGGEAQRRVDGARCVDTSPRRERVSEFISKGSVALLNV